METDKRFIRDRRPGILAVDDDERVSILYRMILEEGYIVHTAMSGEEALKIFDLAMHLGEPQIDLVTLDIRMPEMDGFEVLRRMKEKAPCTPVIICTAYPTYKNSLNSWGCDDYIVKSYNLDELKASVRRHLTE